MLNAVYSSAPAQETITYSVLTKDDVEGAVDCISSTFTYGEPMTKLLGISKKEFDHFAKLFVNKAVTDGLSIVAKDSISGEVIGCLVCEDFITELPEGIETISEKFFPIFGLLEELTNKFKSQNVVAQGELYHLFMGGVRKEFAGKGVIDELTLEAEKLAQSKNFKGAIGEATGPISQHVYVNRFGYQPLDIVEYKEFLFEDAPVFADIQDCEKCQLIIKYFNN
ncbi:hypothetical protein QNI16_00920 [Cytophagaceae bacterium YF14B1]|uniref:N-acetyltransferase domain-containing protein n=1 Tax=Xanthocytophaga flava TaxID=3048013 RepID=A0AAE3QLC2_9BACT|nr:hypothetical protein [Xanthocytophaga flavus]MDJ1479021.1 hypothetical protein [Xanthocytophaga flavus]